MNPLEAISIVIGFLYLTPPVLLLAMRLVWSASLRRPRLKVTVSRVDVPRLERAR
jgi:hypothetical protein